MKQVFIIIGVLMLSACTKEPEATVQQGEFRVERLFTNEGCTAYRFNDAGRYVYYTNCPGTTQESHSTSCGKTTCTETNRVDTRR